MKAFCGIFAVVFGLTGISCFYNLFSGRNPSPPLTLLLLGLFSFAITALCILGIKRSIDKGTETGSSVIAKTKIIDAYGRTSTSSAAARGAVGNLVAGPVGGIVGASTATSKRSTTFLIIYKNGRKQTRTVPNGSFEYQKYVKYLDE